MTPFGVRSLSIYDPYYRLGDNYWTSPIWININFLIVKALHKFSSSAVIVDEVKSEIRLAYEQLRGGVIDMIASEYERTGYIWEVYDD